MCTILGELTRGGVESEFLARTEAEGEDFWCNEEAAAAAKPRDDWKEAKGRRRKAEENTVGGEGHKTLIIKRGRGQTQESRKNSLAS